MRLGKISRVLAAGSGLISTVICIEAVKIVWQEDHLLAVLASGPMITVLFFLEAITGEGRL